MQDGFKKRTVSNKKIRALAWNRVPAGIETGTRVRVLKRVPGYPFLSLIKMLLGFFQYFRQFSRGFSIMSHPMRNCYKKTPFEWGPDQDKALQKLKDALLSDIVLMFPDLNERFYTQSDASKISCAHCHLQMKDGVLRPVAFGGRSSNIMSKSYQPVIQNSWGFYMLSNRIISS
jgi:hypothetical protein